MLPDMDMAMAMVMVMVIIIIITAVVAAPAAEEAERRKRLRRPRKGMTQNPASKDLSFLCYIWLLIGLNYMHKFMDWRVLMVIFLLECDL